MALLLKCGALFLHVPKTGGNFVSEILEENGLVHKYVGPKHSDMARSLYPRMFRRGRKLLSFSVKDRCDRLAGRRIEPNGFRFCFVRDPLSWYESYWKYMCQRRWQGWGHDDAFAVGDWHPNSMLDEAADYDFNAFMRKVIRKRPGYVTEFFSWYTQPNIEFIGKTESLAADLVRVLKLLGLKFDETAILKKAPVNVSKSARPIVWDRDLRDEVMRLEYAGRVRYGYATDCVYASAMRAAA